MNKKILFGAVGIILVLVMLNFFGKLSFLNKYTQGEPDRICSVDSDCVLKPTTCFCCDCGDAVNKYWNAFCPFKRESCKGLMCEICPTPNVNFEVKCILGKCQRVWIN